MKKTINFVVNRMGHSHEILQALYAYYQSLDAAHCSHVDFTLTKTIEPKASLNVYLDCMPSHKLDLSDFGLVLYSNGCEPLKVATETLYNHIKNQDNCYLVCNSKVTDAHEYARKVIWFPANILVCRDLWTRYFTPQFYTGYQMRRNLQRQHKIIFVNGRNDSYRHHFASLLAQFSPNIPQHSTISSAIHETNDSFFESDHDRDFRQTINEMYESLITRNASSNYYTDVLQCGIDGEFGTFPKGYSFLPLYFQYACVIFPESTWQNDELAITEKILKCFYAGTIPWPIGGSNLNRLYNDAGFQTAWNLLPEEYKKFDSDRDHLRRHGNTVKAIKWLESHWEIMQSTEAHEMVALNRERFLTCHGAVDAIQKMHDLLNAYVQ